MSQKLQFTLALCLWSGVTALAIADDHEDRKKDIYNRFEVVHFCRHQTLTGAIDTVFETYCGNYVNLAELAAKDIECLSEVKAKFADADPPVHPTKEPVYVGTIRWRHRDGIGPGEPNIQLYIAARKRKSSPENKPISRVFFFKDGRYQRFQDRLDRVDKTADIGEPGWHGLWKRGVDAALLHPRNGKVYFFRGSEYMRFGRRDGEFVHEKTAVIGKSGWKSGVWRDGVDAVLTHPNGKIHFFKGSEYHRLRYDASEEDFVLDKRGKIGVTGWKGVWREGVDAALVHSNGRAYFFRGKEYKRFNFQTDEVDKTGLVGVDGWMGVNPGVDAALEISDE